MLAFGLGGLTLGLFAREIFLPRSAGLPAPVPALQGVAVLEAAFFLLVYPIVLARRMLAGECVRVRFTLAECATMLGASGVLLAGAAYLADATAVDVLRSAVSVALLWPLAWAAGLTMGRHEAARAWGLAAAGVWTFGLPAFAYIVHELLPAFYRPWMWRGAPLVLCWRLSTSRLALEFSPEAAMLCGWAVLGLAWLTLCVVAAKPSRRAC